jgi:homoprotocatechuate degradation regulator HpaR
MLLMRSREAVMRLFRPSLRAHDVTEQQWRVLRALSHFGECEVTELARITFLHAPSLSRISRDLVRRGLIQRTSVATDRRRGIVSISKRGRDLIQAVAPDSAAGYSQIRRRFGAKRLEALQQMLQELEAALTQPGAPWDPEDPTS